MKAVAAERHSEAEPAAHPTRPRYRLRRLQSPGTRLLDRPVEEHRGHAGGRYPCRTLPALPGRYFCRKLELADKAREISDEKGITPGQLALAWLLRQGDDIVPIPGTKRRERLEENAAATDVTLTDEDLKRIEEAVPRGSVAGERYAERQMRAINR